MPVDIWNSFRNKIIDLLSENTIAHLDGLRNSILRRGIATQDSKICLMSKIKNKEFEDILIGAGNGLFLVRNQQLFKLLPGYFYGITKQKDKWYAYSQDNRWSGSIISFKLGKNFITEIKYEKRGLHPEIHQIDFIKNDLLVTDTANNSILIFKDADQNDFSYYEKIHPFGELSCGKNSSNYKHLNSIYSSGSDLYIGLHNYSRNTSKKSEIAVLNPDNYYLKDIIKVDAESMHNVAYINGSLALCNSEYGQVYIGDKKVEVGSFPRGLSINEENIFVGCSEFATRDKRKNTTGVIYCIDKYTSEVISELRIEKSGPINEVRGLRIDEGLSNHTLSRGHVEYSY